MLKQRIVWLKQPLVLLLRCLKTKFGELIEGVANAADRAESGAYTMSGTSKAKALAQERAKVPLHPRHPAGRCANRSPQIGYRNSSCRRTRRPCAEQSCSSFLRIPRASWFL
jgi:hypothetical protein